METHSASIHAESDTLCLLSSIKWLIDSSAMDHMTCNPSSFSIIQPHKAGSSMFIADGSTNEIASTQICIQFDFREQTHQRPQLLYYILS